MDGKNSKSKMTVEEKLMRARIALQGKKLAKTGHNKFAGYKYFELGDFLPAVQEIFLELGMCGVVSYSSEEATLTITNFDDGVDQIEVRSPMATAALKGAHDIQNLGAVQTYLRRYLWVTAMEIVEHDALDATLGSDSTTASRRAATGRPAAVSRAPERVSQVRETQPETTPVQELLSKVEALGITGHGLRTIEAICEVESWNQIPVEKAMAMIKAIGPQHIKMFNQGKNSKGIEILRAPEKDQLDEKSIDDLAAAVEEAFADE